MYPSISQQKKTKILKLCELFRKRGFLIKVNKTVRYHYPHSAYTSWCPFNANGFIWELLFQGPLEPSFLTRDDFAVSIHESIRSDTDVTQM